MQLSSCCVCVGTLFWVHRTLDGPTLVFKQFVYAGLVSCCVTKELVAFGRQEEAGWGVGEHTEQV